MRNWVKHETCKGEFTVEIETILRCVSSITQVLIEHFHSCFWNIVKKVKAMTFSFYDVNFNMLSNNLLNKILQLWIGGEMKLK